MVTGKETDMLLEMEELDMYIVPCWFFPFLTDPKWGKDSGAHLYRGLTYVGVLLKSLANWIWCQA